MRVEKVASKSLKIEYVVVVGMGIVDKALFYARQNSYGFTSHLKFRILGPTNVYSIEK